MTGAPSPWTDAGWLAEVDRWVAATVGRVGRSVTGDRDQTHVQPWSTAIAYQTDGGRVWFKANGSGTRHEPALLAVLSRLQPDYVPRLLATDLGRAWSLTEDAGPVLRVSVPATGMSAAWQHELPRYAEVQLALASHVPDLLATGAPDRSPGALPGLLEALLDELSALPEDEGGVGEQRRRELERRFTAHRQWCGDLAGSGIPVSIQHDDLHSANLCTSGPGEPSRVIDWGDASVGHPFTTMTATLNSIAHHAGVDLDDPLVAQARDAYLEPFGSYGTLPELRRLVDVARRTGVVTRALSWQDALRDAPVSVRAGLEFPSRAWLEED